MVAQHAAQDVGESDDELAGLFGPGAHQGSDGIQSIEEEVGIDLALEGVEAGFEEEAFLLFEGALDADGVPDFEGNADDHGRAGPDGEADDPLAGDDGEETVGIEAGDPFAEDFDGHDEDEQEYLSIDAGAAEITADPTPQAEVDEGGKGPNLFLVDKAAVNAGGQSDGQEERQGQILAVQHGRDGEKDGSKQGGTGTEENAEEDCGFKGDVGGVEVGNGDANPDAKAQGDADEGEQAESLAESAFLAKEEGLELARSGQSGGDGGGDAQLDQERNEDQFGIEQHRVSVPRREQGWQRKGEEAGGGRGGSGRDLERFYNRFMSIASVRQVADADFPTRWGHFRILGFEGVYTQGPGPCGEAPESEEAVALTMGDIRSAPPLVRVHSQCLTGDVFHSLRCDCRLQLELALRKIAEAGAGVLLYEQQEGRGIGLMAKLRAYELQDQGLDTVEANVQLGFKADCREFELPAAILREMGIGAVRLITNNPEKVAAVEAAGIRVVERVSAEVPTEARFEDYVRVKQEKMGHIFDGATSREVVTGRDTSK